MDIPLSKEIRLLKKFASLKKPQLEQVLAVLLKHFLRKYDEVVYVFLSDDTLLFKKELVPFI